MGFLSNFFSFDNSNKTKTKDNQDSTLAISVETIHVLLNQIISKDKYDSLLPEIILFIVNNQTGSTSAVQRQYSIGYNRAGKIMDQIEKIGIIGPQEGAMPRNVLVKDEKELYSHLKHQEIIKNKTKL